MREVTMMQEEKRGNDDKGGDYKIYIRREHRKSIPSF